MKKQWKLYFVIVFVVLFQCINFNKAFAQDEDYSSYTIGKSKLRLVGSGFTSFKSTWIALDAEISYLEPLHKIKYFKDGKWHTRTHFSTSGSSYGQVGVEYNFEQKSFGLRMGVLQHISLFSINPVQFIYNMGPGVKGFTFRPEAGIGFWIFQLNYGYNVNFRKETNIMGRHLVVFKIHFPF